MKKIILILIILVFIIGCAKQIEEVKEKPLEEKPTEKPVQEQQQQIANPASVYCGEQGGKLDIRTDADGGQIGYCLKDGKECEEWAYYRGECQI